MQSRFHKFSPIEKHGVIGDRRTGALVASDGTLDWWCVPDYDGDVVFGALIDPVKGGFLRLGPETILPGEQHYTESTACLLTRWEGPFGILELEDLMPRPDPQRPEGTENSRIILRRLRVVQGNVANVRMEARPRLTFDKLPRVCRSEDSIQFDFPGGMNLRLWTSFDSELDGDGAFADFTLNANEEAWAVLALNNEPFDWNVAQCKKLHEQTMDYWRSWTAGLKIFPQDNPKLQRSAITVHLLAHAPNNASVAAVTTSLPERIGGDRNYDYRYTWVRDASFSAAFLAIMGNPTEVSRYFDWLCDLDSQVEAPLQVCYRTDGRMTLDTHKLQDVRGYRGSTPVQFGNRAYKQRQLGSLGWFADSALIFLEAGGEWKPAYWKMVQRCAEYVCKAWHEADSGLWELTVEAHYVASKVMAWVTLDRAIRIASRMGEEAPPQWKIECEAIRDEILSKGWSEKHRSFRQRYDSHALDASSLLIPLMNFLSPDDPRVLDTLDALERELVIDGLLHRFDPAATLGGEQLPLGKFEGAFLPATFWHAHALALAGRTNQAAAILRKCEEIAGGPGIFAEEADARLDIFLGNTPLLFAQVEYGRALIALHKQQSKPNIQGQ